MSIDFSGKNSGKTQEVPKPKQNSEQTQNEYQMILRYNTLLIQQPVQPIEKRHPNLSMPF